VTPNYSKATVSEVRCWFPLLTDVAVGLLADCEGDVSCYAAAAVVGDFPFVIVVGVVDEDLINWCTLEDFLRMKQGSW
jgi:hypothetical protein